MNKNINIMYNVHRMLNVGSFSTNRFLIYDDLIEESIRIGCQYEKIGCMYNAVE